MRKFVDSNFFLRFLTNDIPSQAKKAEKILKQAEQGKINLFTPDLVIAEVAWTLESFYKEPKEKIAANLRRILLIKNLEVPFKNNWLEALEIFQEEKIELIDAFNYSLIRSRGIREILTFDKHFNKLTDVKRIVI